MKYLNHDWCSVGGGWAREECCRPRRCGRSTEVTVPVAAERKIPALLYTSSHRDISILIPSLSLSPSLSVTSSLHCTFLRYFLRSAPLLSFPASYSYLYKDRWGAEEMKEPASNTHAHTCSSLLAQISKYITSKPLSFWRSLHHVCVLCVCMCVYMRVCPSGPWVLLSVQTLSLMTPPWFRLDNAPQSDSSLFPTARWITYSIYVTVEGRKEVETHLWQLL